ncbi:MAG: hypothetical protein IIV57_00375, partial [Bacteroidaceae bacterium]|nr:hypothetical protein [Bacteroidaceae bacterium]
MWRVKKILVGWLSLLVALMYAPALLAAEAAGPVLRADSLMRVLSRRIAANEFAVGEASGTLYVRQEVDIEKKNLGLNFIPGMARFDRDEHHYLSELCYDVRFFKYAMPAIRRRASVTTHRHGSGEIERVLLFMHPNLFAEKILEEGYLSPLHPQNIKYYRYSADTLYDDKNGCVKVSFVHRFDNIKLLESGWVLLAPDCSVRAFSANGWDEQCTFSVHYVMGNDSLQRNLATDVSLSVDYNFAGNKFKVNAEGRFLFDTVLPVADARQRVSKYNIAVASSEDLPDEKIDDRIGYVASMRKQPLSLADSLFYYEKGVFGALHEAKKNSSANDAVGWLWDVGDRMISSHSLEWNGGRVRVSPLINPSYLSYSTGRGLSYKMALNLTSATKRGEELSLRPMAGYNFKQGAFYWDVDGRYLYSPRRLGTVRIDVGSGNRTYSSEALNRIEKIAADSLNFEDLDLGYFRNFYVNISHSHEIANGIELLGGFNYHRRTLIGSGGDRLEASGVGLKRRYIQFAPHIRLTWHPGMYYYIKGTRKVNIGSRLPRFSFDIEQGVDGVLGSSGTYTRAELDVQYNFKINESDALFLRAGGGGFFYTKNTYFVDYAFLRHNSLPVDRSDELDGVFQLLDSEWYNAANKYFRTNVTYLSPFFVLQRILLRVNFIKNERLYLNMLFISHLTPYSEFGYGVGTP